MIKRKTNRIKKIEQQIYKEISIILQQKNKNSNSIITITKVIISKNLMYAKIYVTILNCILKNKKKIFEERQIKKLQLFSKKIRYLLSKHIKLRFIPNLIFIYDRSLKDSLYITSLLNKTN
ncbi:30S ribosome-binding factor RbfA [Enterobacterales bacterium endosymbiont of Anomoneura mori]|uniref:30S ribosome-binding factor RbfA n=1 Tax=Enterobacterales bacterium endosymbiont of Anomoneura mori TaxID=3132096 RepID=UPI00399D0503